MAYSLGKGSLKKLRGVHPDLVRVVRRAIKLTSLDFSVLEGVRSEEKQRKLFESGASKIMKSRHLLEFPANNPELGAVGHAVDIGAYVDGGIRWDWPLYPILAKAMKQASTLEKVAIRWGGDWDGDGNSDDESFLDGPHFELLKKSYPIL